MASWRSTEFFFDEAVLTLLALGTCFEISSTRLHRSGWSVMASTRTNRQRVQGKPQGGVVQRPAAEHRKSLADEDDRQAKLWVVRIIPPEPEQAHCEDPGDKQRVREGRRSDRQGQPSKQEAQEAARVVVQEATE